MGYAITDHVAQGRTVTAGLAVITGAEDRPHALVTLTRGTTRPRPPARTRSGPLRQQEGRTVRRPRPAQVLAAAIAGRDLAGSRDLAAVIDTRLRHRLGTAIPLPVGP